MTACIGNEADNTDKHQWIHEKIRVLNKHHVPGLLEGYIILPVEESPNGRPRKPQEYEYTKSQKPGQYSGYICKKQDKEFYSIDGEMFLTMEQVQKLKEGGW